METAGRGGLPWSSGAVEKCVALGTGKKAWDWWGLQGASRPVVSSMAGRLGAPWTVRISSSHSVPRLVHSDPHVKCRFNLVKSQSRAFMYNIKENDGGEGRAQTCGALTSAGDRRFPAVENGGSHS